MTAQEFCDFVNACPTPFHFCDYASATLKSHGFVELSEADASWPADVKKAFVIRDGSALIAWNLDGLESAIIVGTHCDSPCLKIKPSAEKNDRLLSVDVATYGGGLWGTYVARDLRLAGRVLVKGPDGARRWRLFDSREAVAFLPPKPKAEQCKANIDTNTDLNPVLGLSTSKGLRGFVADKLGLESSEAIESWELSFVSAEPASVIGTRQEFVASHRIDNLGSTFSAMKAFLASKPAGTLNVLVVFDHEEIGSNTRTGARGNLMPTVLERIVGKEKLAELVARSLVVSSDNAHAVHPNYAEKHDPMHAPVMGGGTVLKRSPGPSYATDMTSAYPLKMAAKKLGLALQILINRNDVPSGSTIGPHVSTQMGIATVDIGQPQLAMHSLRELVAVEDVQQLVLLLQELYNHFEEFRLK